MNAINKPNEVSMFKVGDIVVYKDIEHEHGLFPTYLFEVTRVIKKWNYMEIKETKCWHQNRKRWGSYGDDVRPATKEEIAAGHRIDLETLRDCDTSPNCKKFDEQVK